MTAAFPSLVESIRLQTRFSIPVVSTFMKRIFFSGSLSLCAARFPCCYFCKANSFAFEREYASILHWGRGSRKVLWAAAAHRLSSNAFIIFIICSSHTSLLLLFLLLQLSSNSKAVSQSTVQFGSLVFLSLVLFSPFIQWLFFFLRPK